jgi:hypothetical protein
MKALPPGSQPTAIPPSSPVFVVEGLGLNSTLPYRACRPPRTWDFSKRLIPAGLVNTVAASWARAA